jgi:hypothetical protein
LRQKIGIIGSKQTSALYIYGRKLRASPVFETLSCSGEPSLRFISKRLSLCFLPDTGWPFLAKREATADVSQSNQKSLRVHLSRSPNSSSPYSREGTALPCGFTRLSIFLFFPFFIRQLRKIEPRNPDCSKSLKKILQY